MNRPFHIGAQNDALYIISGEAPATTNDYPRHDADRTCVASVVDEAEARRLVQEHAALRAALDSACEAFEAAEPYLPNGCKDEFRFYASWEEAKRALGLNAEVTG